MNRLFTESVHGKGQVVLITGPGASGKSELVSAFHGRAEDEGALVLSAAGSRAERVLPLGVMGQLFRSAVLPHEMTEQVEHLLRPEPMGFTADEPDPVTLGQRHAQVAYGLCALLLELARDRPVVLSVDDVHHADGPSLQALLYIQRRLTSSRTMLVLSEWQQPRPAYPLFHAELTRQPNCTRVRLAPLSGLGVEELLREHMAAEDARRLAPVFHAVSGGNLVLLHGLIEDHCTVAAVGHGGACADAAIATGESFRQAVLSCLHRWEPRLLEVAQAAALLGESASAFAVARLLKVKAASVEPVLGALNTTGLLDDVRFRHPAVRAAVLGDLAPEGQAVMHLRAARLMYQDGAAPAEIAGHLITAGGGVDEGWMADVLRDAAKQALATGEAERAIECLDLALQACGDERERAAITALLARVQWGVNPSAVSRLIRPLTAAFERGHLDGTDVMALGRYLFWHGRGEEAATTLGWFDGSPHESDSWTQAELDLTRDWLRLCHPRLPTAEGTPFTANGGAPGMAAVTAPGAAQRTAQRRGGAGTSAERHRGVRTEATLTDVMNNGRGDEAIGRAEQVLQSCRLSDTVMESVLGALLVFIHADRLDKAVHWCVTLGDEAKTRGLHAWSATLADMRARVALRQGDLAAAERHARQALADMSPQSWGVAVGSPMAHLLQATTAMGRLAEAEELTEQVVPEDMAHTWFWPRYLYARGHYYLASNRLHAALGDFQTCGALLKDWNLDLPGLLPWRTASGQVYLRLGRPEAARELVVEQLGRPGAGNPRVRGVSLRVLAATGDVKKRAPMLKEAVERLQESGDRLELALALADLSDAHHKLGEFARARLMARRAKQIAKSCHAEALCQRLLPSEGADGAGDKAAGPSSETEVFAVLSDAERRVAALAALGHTNREIGGKLFITVSTVEQHLTRVYRKLNVNRRTDLPTELPLLMADTAG
ncbi:tetratricopeptide (TPR) repeat protein/energy-coupling factor transporter ATP-binding protein EcfA2 [Nocardiopsis mwathae]|uniref:Tetratricopeptide (TPR) repeat protein/energy-coupling factor transporter ATP-binding protein EcfA2 n=1 Tax=Nocardiopsis mwathae TaxID=1472723 RepID=A0A7X0D3K3_9ACTN|nr:tetratricopeptide (TPR) repeat protein/energy-coupling factor transporter ATP-binding protein EcfA2 [Nocardiopsis mwathae]